MAQAIQKPQIKQLPVQHYEAVRDELRSGDLVFCSGSYIFSGLIQRFTRSLAHCHAHHAACGPSHA